jgi:hypothetical protein
MSVKLLVRVQHKFSMRRQLNTRKSSNDRKRGRLNNLRPKLLGHQISSYRGRQPLSCVRAADRV